MSRAAWRVVLLALAGAASAARAQAVDRSDDAQRVSGSVTGFYYAMRDQSDFGVGVAAVNRGPLRFEARYNYEAKRATSLFVGWKVSGGDALTYEITPIAGALFGSAHALIPGFEASVAYRAFDAYVEAEYVVDRGNRDDSYVYAWSEIAWRPVEWVRFGLVGQRTRVVDSERSLQRGVFGQLVFGRLTVGLYAFNPDAGSRYAIVSVGASF